MASAPGAVARGATPQESKAAHAAVGADAPAVAQVENASEAKFGETRRVNAKRRRTPEAKAMLSAPSADATSASAHPLSPEAKGLRATSSAEASVASTVTEACRRLALGAKAAPFGASDEAADSVLKRFRRSSWLPRHLAAARAGKAAQKKEASREKGLVELGGEMVRRRRSSWLPRHLASAQALRAATQQSRRKSMLPAALRERPDDESIRRRRSSWLPRHLAAAALRARDASSAAPPLKVFPAAATAPVSATCVGEAPTRGPARSASASKRRCEARPKRPSSAAPSLSSRSGRPGRPGRETEGAHATAQAVAEPSEFHHGEKEAVGTKDGVPAVCEQAPRIVEDVATPVLCSASRRRRRRSRSY